MTRPPEAAAVEAAVEEVAAIAGQVAGCARCADLAATRTRTVPGDLPAGAVGGLVLVGEAPGADEDAAGRPFVGRAGRLLDELLAGAGLDRDRVGVANVLKCRPPGNRAPLPTEIALCRPYLERQLAAVRPGLVVALGLSATRWFLGPRVALGAVRGQVHEVTVPAAAPVPVRVKVLPTYHPSAALRFGPAGEPRRLLADDLALAASLTGGS